KEDGQNFFTKFRGNDPEHISRLLTVKSLRNQEDVSPGSLIVSEISRKTKGQKRILQIISLAFLKEQEYNEIRQKNIYLQGRVQVPTGGKAREPKGRIR